MLIRFQTEALAKTCSRSELLQKRWGNEKGRLLETRLFQIAAMPNLRLVAAIPGILTNPVRPNQQGVIIAAVLLPLRIVFMVDHDPLPLNEDGSARCEEIAKIVVLEVLDDGE